MGKIKVSNGTETFEIDGNDLQSAIKDGYKPTERIIVANSKTNESYEIDPQDVESALNDGFTYSDIVKKNGASQPLSTEPVKPSKDILTLSRERKELQNKISGARSTTRTATAAPGGYVSTTDSGAEEYKKQLADANESIKAQGGDEQLAEDIWDIPQGEGFSFVKDIPGLMKLRNENKYAYGRELAAIKSKGNLYNAVRDKSDVQTANNVIQGLQQLEKKDYRSATKDGIGLIREYVDDTDEQNKLIKDYVANKAYDYGAQPIDEEWLSQYPNLNPYQARAMRFMQDVDPATFQAYQRLMSVTPDEQWMGSREEDIRRGYEMKGKELEDIGMNLQMKAYEESLTDLKNKVDAGQQFTPEEQNKYNSILDEYQTLAADKQNQNQRYPSVSVMDADRLMQEALGSKNSIVKKFALGVGENFDDAVNWVGDLIQDKGINGDLELLGDKEMSGLNRYTSEKDKLVGSEFVTKFLPDLQKQIDQVKSSELSDEQKQDKVRELILNNQDQVQTIANDKAGKYNFTSKAVFNVVGDVASDLVSQLAIGAMTGGGGNASKIKNLTSLFGSTFATAYNDYYNDALKQNIANPTQYAILHTSIEAASELINDDFEVAKKLVGKGTTLGKVLNKATREEWDAIAKKGFFDKFKDAAVQTGKSALGNALQETKEEVAGQIAGNIVDQQIFNKESGLGEGIKDTMIQTMVGMLPLGLLSLPFNYHNVNRTQKYAMYEAGMNPDKFIQAIDNDVASGAITQQEAKERKLNVEAAARAVKSSPALRIDGTPMTDNEKAEYAFNQSVLLEIKEQKKNATPEIKEKLDDQEREVLNEQTELVSPKPKNTVKSVMDKPAIFKGQRGYLYQDGQTVVFKVEGKNKEYEIGNIDELSDQSISDYGIDYEINDVSIGDDGSISVKGKKYKNDYSNPLMAISRDSNGNVVSVSLSTDKGAKRTFRGSAADDIAYNIILNNITKDSENKSKFETFINKDESAKQKVESARLSEIAEEKSNGNNEKVQRIKETSKPVVNEKETNKEALIKSSISADERNIIERAVKDGDISDVLAPQAKENPSEFFKMVADQIYGLNADGSQSLLPDAEKATREQYGNKVVDKAKELYPLTQKTETDASTVRSDQGQVIEGGQVAEGGQNVGGQDIQPSPESSPVNAETQQQAQGEEKWINAQRDPDVARELRKLGYERIDIQKMTPAYADQLVDDQLPVQMNSRFSKEKGTQTKEEEVERLPEDVYVQMYNDYRQNLEEDEAPLSLNEFKHRIETETLTEQSPSERAINKEIVDKKGRKYKAIVDSHGKGVYSVKVYDDSKRIGTLRLTKLKGTNDYYATGVDVNNKYQRKGIATKMYDLAEKEFDINIVPSAVQSKEGKAFWSYRKINKSGQEVEINTPEDLERELGKIFAEEPVPVKEQVEGVVVTPNKEKKPKPIKEKKEKPVLKPKEQEQADYAYTNSYPYFKKKYPDVDVDEYNRLRSLKRQQGLPKLGEINQDNNVRPKGEDITQYTPQSIIQKAREFYKGDPLIKRVLSFLEPIIKANTNIKIDTSFKWDSPQYEGQKITNQALGYSFPSGNLILNFDRMSDYDTLYRTALHEMVHAATRTEIETNKAFNEDLKKVLVDVRRAMKLPEGDSVVDALIRNKVISEDYDTRYGAANEHELLAEVFTNQKFSEFLKGLEYKGDNMLHRLFLAIAKFFSQKYKALVSAKESISVDNIADYLMGLTESVVAGQQEQSKGGALPLIRPGIKEVLKKTITKAREKNLSEQIIRDKLKQIGGLTDQEVDELMAEVVPLAPSAAPARELTEEEVGATPTEPKRKSKFRRFKEKYFDRAKGMPDWVLKYKDRAKGTAHLEVRQALQLVEKTRKTAKNIGFDDWELFDRALRDQYYGSQLLELQALPIEMQILAVQMRNKIDGLSRDLIINNYVTPEQALNIESNIGEYMTRSYRAFNEKDWGKKVPQKAKDDAFRLLTQQRFNELLIEREDDVNTGSVTEDELIEGAKMEAFNELKSIIDGISDKYTPPKINVQKGKDLGILKQRQDIPKEIREVLGEYTDPGVNFAMTIARIASLKSSAEYLTSIRREGAGEIFFEADSRPPEASVQIKSEGSETWNPLNGLYTTPEVKEVFDETEVIRNKWVQLWLKGVGAIKWGKTVGSLVTQVKNFESNLGFALMNGHYRAGKSSESFKFLKDKLFKGERSQDEMIEKVIRLGIVDQSIGVRELKDMFAADNLDKVIVNSSLGEKSPLKKIGNNLIGKPIKYLNKVYGASDDFWKVYGFLNEAESLSKATYNKSYKELTDDEQSSVDIEASERVKNVYPTYDRVWEGAKSLSKGLPIFGNFLSFQAESIRVLLNTFNYAIKDLKTPGRTLMGAQRLAGIGAYIGARSMILYTIAQMTGVGMAGLLGLASDDDEDQKLKDVNRYSPEFIRSGDKLTLDHGGGKYTVYDVGGLEPYGVWFKTMNAFNEGNDIVKDGGLAASATELLSPFFEPEMSFKMAMNIYNNENDFGSRIYNPMDESGDKALDVMEFIIKKAKPSTIDLIQRIYSKEDKTNEVSAIFGGRGYDVDIAKSFSFKLKAAEELFDANRDALNKIKYNGESTEDQIAEAEIKFEERTNKVIKMLSEDYQAAIRLGTSIEALDEILSRKKFFQGYNKNVKNQIKSGAVEQESASEEIKEWQP